jgi:hypothetical protein
VACEPPAYQATLFTIQVQSAAGIEMAVRFIVLWGEQAVFLLLLLLATQIASDRVLNQIELVLSSYQCVSTLPSLIFANNNPECCGLYPSRHLRNCRT